MEQRINGRAVDVVEGGRAVDAWNREWQSCRWSRELMVEL